MATVLTRELSGASLDYAVGLCEGVKVSSVERWLQSRRQFGPLFFEFSAKWSLFAERERISVVYQPTTDQWVAGTDPVTASGPSPGVAVLRCYCQWKFGEDVDVPNELLNVA